MRNGLKDLRELIHKVLFVNLTEDLPPVPAAPYKVASMDFSFLTFEEMVQARMVLAGSRVHILSLRSFKDSIEEEWGLLAKKINLAAENTISRHLGSKDRCSMESDDTYIFLFSRSADEEAQETVRKITGLLMRRLIGERFAGLRIAIAEAEVAALLDAHGRLDHAALDAVIRSARPFEADPAEWLNMAPPQDRPPPAWSALDRPGGAGDGGAADGGPGWTVLETAAPSGRDGTAALQGGPGRPEAVWSVIEPEPRAPAVLAGQDRPAGTAAIGSAGPPDPAGPGRRAPRWTDLDRAARDGGPAVLPAQRPARPDPVWSELAAAPRADGAALVEQNRAGRPVPVMVALDRARPPRDEAGDLPGRKRAAAAGPDWSEIAAEPRSGRGRLVAADRAGGRDPAVWPETAVRPDDAAVPEIRSAAATPPDGVAVPAAGDRLPDPVPNWPGTGGAGPAPDGILLRQDGPGGSDPPWPEHSGTIRPADPVLLPGTGPARDGGADGPDWPVHSATLRPADRAVLPGREAPAGDDPDWAAIGAAAPSDHPVASDPRPEPPVTAPPWSVLAWPPEGIKRPKALDIPPLDPADALPEGTAIGFQPAWNARTEQIDTCIAVALRRRPGGRAEAAVPPAAAGATALATLDFALLFAGLEQILRNIEARHRVLTIVPIRFSTLQPPHLDTVLSILRYFPDAARARYLLLEITHCPAGSPAADAAALERRLRSLCRDLLLRLGGGGPDLAAIDAFRPLALGIAEPRLEPHLLALLPRPARSYLWGAGGAGRLDAVLDHGHWLLGGRAVGPVRPAPQDVELLPRQRLLGRARPRPAAAEAQPAAPGP